MKSFQNSRERRKGSMAQGRKGVIGCSFMQLNLYDIMWYAVVPLRRCAFVPLSPSY
jgi:hypothetical protein